VHVLVRECAHTHICIDAEFGDQYVAVCIIIVSRTA